MKKQIRIVTGTAAGIAAVVCIAVFLISRGYFLPSWIEWHSRQYEIPSNPLFLKGKVILERKNVSMVLEDGTLSRIPEEYRISDLLLGDIDHDGMPEALMTSWTRGDYGESHPFFEHPNMLFYTQRFYIYNLDEDGLKPQWMSSRLPLEIHQMRLNEANNLVVTDETGTESEWFWDSWGMTLKK